MTDDPQAGDEARAPGARGVPSARRPSDAPRGSRPDEPSASSEGPAQDAPSTTAKSGIELAREALAQAKADARKRGTLPGQGRRKGPRVPAPSRMPGRGGDPRRFGSAIRDLLADRGWEQRAAVGGVFGNWAGMVGPVLAEHTRPEKFEDGELVIFAESPTWATQVRSLAAQLVRRLNEELGHGTVKRVKVVGPASGPRRAGGWRVR